MTHTSRWFNRLATGVLLATGFLVLTSNLTTVKADCFGCRMGPGFGWVCGPVNDDKQGPEADWCADSGDGSWCVMPTDGCTRIS
jgi:hypothetical protein